MGQSNKPNPKYGNALDCYITNAQKFINGLLGDTVGAGLAAVFFKDGYLQNAVTGLYEDFIPKAIRDNKLVRAVTSQLNPMMLIPGYGGVKLVQALFKAASNPGATAASIKDASKQLADGVSAAARATAKAAEDAARASKEAAEYLARETARKAEEAAMATKRAAEEAARRSEEAARATARAAEDAARATANAARTPENIDRRF